MSGLISREQTIKAIQESEFGYTYEVDVAIEAVKSLPSAEPERTVKATRKPEAFFYRCECGYGLCCEKNDMNYCPHCGGRLEWEDGLV